MRRDVVDLPGGTLEYLDTGGSGRAVVLLHGALMDDALWHGVIERLPSELRCVVPILPMGAHRLAIPDSTDVSPSGIGELVYDLLTALDLRDPVEVGNDTGGAVAQLLLAAHPEAAAGLVLVSCDAFDNFPPGLPGRVMALATSVPGGLRMALACLRWRPLRRLPMTYGWMTKRPIPDAVFDRWLDAFAADRGVRRDVHRMMRGVDRRQLVAAAAALASFDRPALVVWAAEDRVMPIEHAHRLAEALPQARVVVVPDSYTLVPLDQPDMLARLIADFVAESPRVGGRQPGHHGPR